MELITAIALLCQINIGSGTGEYNAHKNSIDIFDTNLRNVKTEQIECQKKMAACVLKDSKGVFQTRNILKCIKER